MTDRGLGIDSSSNVWWDCSREDAYTAPSATAASSPGCSKTSERRSDSIGMTVRIASESASQPRARRALRPELALVEGLVQAALLQKLIVGASLDQTAV